MRETSSSFLSLILASGLFLFCAQTALTHLPDLTEKPANFHAEKGSYHFNTDNGTYVLRFFSQEILEVEFFPKENKRPSDVGLTLSESQQEVRDNVLRSSHAVIMEPRHTDVQVTRTEDDIIRLSTDGISVVFDLRDSKFSFYHNGRRLLKEHNGFVQNPDNDGYRVDFRISATEMLMGGGSRALGMDRRGHRLELYNRAHYGYETRSELINYTLPMVLSSRRYAIHFDNPTTGYLDLDSQNDGTLGFEAFSGRQTYQIIAGDTWESIIDNYTQLTGRQPLPPRWALGNFSSRFGYRSQQEVVNTIALFREKEIPVDAIIIDLYWFGQEVLGTMGNLRFDEETFPDPAQMVQQLESKGVKTVLITEPFVLTTSGRWDEAVQEGVLALDTLGAVAVYNFFFGETGLIDLFKPQAREWFWGIYRDMMETYGIHGWWGDLGEPEVHPDWLRHYGNLKAREVHNIFGHQWARMVFEGFRNDFPERRAFNLMRAGYSGSQRYGMIPWTGDVSRSWGGLMPQPEISLQMGLQGLAYMHSDLGGFAGDLVDDELYVRWMQYGVFQPVYRPHAQDDVPSEPVFRSEEAMQLSKKAIELRYQLMPYIYTAAFQNSQTGLPFMRPLFFEEPDNFELYRVSSTYLFGDDILVAPVLRQGEREVEVHMPTTANWFDFYTGKMYQGGQQHRVQTHKDRIPTFVRGGAAIPMADLVQTTADYSVEHITLKFFFDEGASRFQTRIYHDDGLTSDAYQKGMYEMLDLSIEPSVGGAHTNHVRFRLETQRGEQFEDAGFSRVTVRARNISAEPQSAFINGEAVSFTYDKERQMAEFSTFAISEGENIFVFTF
ncbi:MAG: TIM-barrel domain-containing protein [Bacteroidales bacterium]